jgi:beta-ribofuranosylaminobenzene 5'-phosphate synthase
MMTQSAAVEVFAPARLHLGFLDLNGTTGRLFGSIGVAIDGIGTHLTLRKGAPASGLPGRAERLLASVAERLGMSGSFHLTLHASIPEHIGLGSGTQLGLSIAAALSVLEERLTPARTLALLVERGARSGIGVGAFETGGFLVDGGKGGGDNPPPIVARAEFPDAWRLILIFDRERRGFSGAKEVAAFRTLPTFPETLAARLCHLTLMRLLPGIHEGDLDAVGASIGEIQAHVGDHFAPAQGGRYTSPRVAAVLKWLEDASYAGVGQSSWGPTGFVLVGSEEEAQSLSTDLAHRFEVPLSFSICRGRNHGAEIKRM